MATPSSNANLWSDEERWQILMEGVKDFGIFMLSPEGVILTWGQGAERILGYQESEIHGHNFCEIFTPADIDREIPQFELQTARERGRAEDERWHVRKDGTQLWASGVVTPLWDADGQLRGFAKVLRDITERKREEDRLIEENQRKDEFLAMLSHELRNPLSAIASATDLLRTTGSEGDQSTVQIIERQVRSLTVLINDLTDASRMKTGKMQLHLESVILNQVIHEAIEAASHAVNDRQHQLSIDVPTEPIWIRGDPYRLKQVISNLLDNAIKYTEPGGNISIAAEQVGVEAHIHLRDSGVGILTEMQGRIFDLFVQVDRSLNRAQGGLGIGLSLVKRLVEMHGGTISVSSEGAGCGSEFHITLPTSAPPEIVAQIEESITKPTAQQLDILVVDDNRDTALILSVLLKRLGHVVTVCHDGATAVQTAIENPPHLMITDIGLPNLNGYEVAERLRKHPGLENLSLVALTGYGQEADRVRSQQAGFDLHLVKPVSIDDLQNVLRGFQFASRARRAETSNQESNESTETP